MQCTHQTPELVGDLGRKHLKYEGYANWNHTATSKVRHGSSSSCHKSYQEILSSLTVSERTHY